MLAAGAASTLQACDWSTAGAIGTQDSRWRETKADGSTLLREQGQLAQAGLTLAADGCAGASWHLRLQRADGDRRYDGQTASGIPLQTHSSLREQALTLQWLPLAWGRWQGGTRLLWQRTDRSIQSTSTALGYPERHEAVQLALVLAGHGPLHAPAWRWHAELALGGGPAGRLRLDLPGYDRAVLRLGESRLGQAAVGLEGDAGPNWGWRLTLQHTHERRRTAEPSALTRNGRVVGGALQPATTRSATSLVAGLSWRFGH